MNRLEIIEMFKNVSVYKEIESIKLEKSILKKREKQLKKMIIKNNEKPH
jgi:hypothetical protein